MGTEVGSWICILIGWQAKEFMNDRGDGQGPALNSGLASFVRGAWPKGRGVAIRDMI